MMESEEDEREAHLPEFESFVFSTILPLIHHFYVRGYKPSSEEKKVRTNKLSDSVYKLREVIKSDKRLNSITTKTLKTLFNAGGVGEDEVDSIYKLLHSTHLNVHYSPPKPKPDQFHLRYGVPNINRLENPVYHAKRRELSRGIYEALAYRYLFSTQAKKPVEEVPEETIPKGFSLSFTSRKGTQYSSLDTVEVENDTVEPTNDYLPNFVAIISNPSIKDMKLVKQCLKIIHAYISLKGASIPPLKDRLGRLAALGAPLHIARLMGSPFHKTQLLAIEIMALMLDDDGVTSTAVSDVLNQSLPSNEKFFHCVRRILNETKEKIKTFKHQPMKRKQWERHPWELSFSELYLDDNIYHLFRILELMAGDPKSPMFKQLLTGGGQQGGTDINLVREVVSFLKTFEGAISAANMKLGVQIFNTLRQWVSTNSRNQFAVVKGPLLSIVNKLMKSKRFRIPLDGPGYDTHLDALSVELKLSITDFLLALLEKENKEDDESFHIVIESVVEKINPKIFEFNTRKMLGDTTGIPLPEGYVSLASKTLDLINLLVNLGAELKPKVIRKCEANCRSRIGRIEVVDDQDQLKLVHFPIPADFRRPKPPDFENSILGQVALSVPGVADYFFKKREQERKQKKDSYREQEARLNAKLDNRLITDKNVGQFEKAVVKIESFMEWSDETLRNREMKHVISTHKKTTPIFSTVGNSSYRLGKSFKFMWALSYFIACVLNVVIITSESNWGREEWATITIKVLGSIECFLCFWLLIAWGQRHGARILRKEWLKTIHDGKSYLLYPWKWVKENQLKQTYKYEIFFWLGSWWFLAKRLEVIFLIVQLLFSLLGTITTSPLWFGYHLFSIMIVSEHLKVMSKSITDNLLALFLTTVVAVEVVYILSIIAFSAFQGRYSVEDGSPCTTVAQCFFTNIYFGLPAAGGLYQFVGYNIHADPYTGRLTGETIMWVAYNVIFFFFVAVVFLNIILGIIVDTFQKYRDDRETTARDLDSRCFICSLEREVFLQSGIDYSAHTEQQHNRLHYLYFFAYLKDKIAKKQTKSLSPLEAYIEQQISNRNFLRFLPFNRAISLEGEDEDVNIRKQLRQKFHNLEKRFDQTIDSQEKSLKQIINGNAQMTYLIDTIATMKNQLCELRRILQHN
eukprot:TRINITY_DN7066_c0_g1_i1.p1 TRINITY_DN7066_c0_g1~~TRINITY_DN7066_c0_g1_i1.p1  ORF type:complete len:1333 (+),score=282.87 TRINITY_DN7066_c0_g1_i1:578-4000(+)